MAEAWPTGVPMYIDRDSGFNESPAENRIKQNMSVGPPKVRRRATSGVRKLSGSIIITKANVDTLDNWYTTTLADGSLTFDFTHPRTEAAIVCMFDVPPKYTDIGGGYWRVEMQLDIMP